MKAIGALIGVGFFILFLGLAIMPALTGFRGESVTAPYNISSGNTTATITLANDVLDDNKVNIHPITSNEATDAPVAWTYVADTHVLTVSGLDSGVSRQLSVTYLYPRLDGITDTAAHYTPTFLILAGIAVAGGAAMAAWKEAH